MDLDVILAPLPVGVLEVEAADLARYAVVLDRRCAGFLSRS